jgi:hypothetical protein
LTGSSSSFLTSALDSHIEACFASLFATRLDIETLSLQFNMQNFAILHLARIAMVLLQILLDPIGMGDIHWQKLVNVVEFAMHTVLSGVTNMDQISSVILLLINMSFNTMHAMVPIILSYRS